MKTPESKDDITDLILNTPTADIRHIKEIEIHNTLNILFVPLSHDEFEDYFHKQMTKENIFPEKSIVYIESSINYDPEKNAHKVLGKTINKDIFYEKMLNRSVIPSTLAYVLTYIRNIYDALDRFPDEYKQSIINTGIHLTSAHGSAYRDKSFVLLKKIDDKDKKIKIGKDLMYIALAYELLEMMRHTLTHGKKIYANGINEMNERLRSASKIINESNEKLFKESTKKLLKKEFVCKVKLYLKHYINNKRMTEEIHKKYITKGVNDLKDNDFFIGLTNDTSKSQKRKKIKNILETLVDMLENEQFPSGDVNEYFNFIYSDSRRKCISFEKIKVYELASVLYGYADKQNIPEVYELSSMINQFLGKITAQKIYLLRAENEKNGKYKKNDKIQKTLYELYNQLSNEYIKIENDEMQKARLLRHINEYKSKFDKNITSNEIKKEYISIAKILNPFYYKEVFDVEDTKRASHELKEKINETYFFLGEMFLYSHVNDQMYKLFFNFKELENFVSMLEEYDQKKENSHETMNYIIKSANDNIINSGVLLMRDINIIEKVSILADKNGVNNVIVIAGSAHIESYKKLAQVNELDWEINSIDSKSVIKRYDNKYKDEEKRFQRAYEYVKDKINKYTGATTLTSARAPFKVYFVNRDEKTGNRYIVSSIDTPPKHFTVGKTKRRHGQKTRKSVYRTPSKGISARCEQGLAENLDVSSETIDSSRANMSDIGTDQEMKIENAFNIFN